MIGRHDALPTDLFYERSSHRAFLRILLFARFVPHSSERYRTSQHQPVMKLPSISYLDTAENLATAIAGRSHHGIFQLTDLPVTAPFTDLAATMDLLHANPDVTARLNRAYQKNLVYKDSFGNHKGGPNVDVKRVLDLSPERLHAIRMHDPELMLADAATTTTTTTTEPLVSKTLAFWQALQDSVAPKLVEAVALAVGSDDVRADAAYNYRLVDYYTRCRPAIDDDDFGTFSLSKFHMVLFFLYQERRLSLACLHTNVPTFTASSFSMSVQFSPPMAASKSLSTISGRPSTHPVTTTMVRQRRSCCLVGARRFGRTDVFQPSCTAFGIMVRSYRP
jgi:hypothetical protein